MNRLEIANDTMQTLLKRAKEPFTIQQVARDAIRFTDALLAEAGEPSNSAPSVGEIKAFIISQRKDETIEQFAMNLNRWFTKRNNLISRE